MSNVLDEYTEEVVGATLEEVVEQPRDLHNGTKPAYELKRERARHRVVIMMASSGMTYTAIAEALGMTPAAVSYIVQQPWAKEQILREIEKLGRQEVLAVIKDHALEAVDTIIDVMRTASTKEVRLKAANALLDREFGKPNQPITHREEVNLDECTDEELAKIAVSKN